MPNRNTTSEKRWHAQLENFVDWIDHGLDVSERCLLVAAVLVMAAISVVNVILRNLTGNSLLFANDLTQVLLVVVTFMGISLGARQARHIRVSAIHDLLPARARKILLIAINLVTAGLMFALTGWALDYAHSTQRSCRVLPDDLELAGIPLSLAAIPASLGLVAVVALMALAGKAIAALPHKARQLVRTQSGWLGLTVVLLGGLALIVIAGGSIALFVDLVSNRTGSCRVMPSTGLPIYLIHLVVPLGLGLAGLQFFLAAVRNLISAENYLSWHQRDAYLDKQEDADG